MSTYNVEEALTKLPVSISNIQAMMPKVLNAAEEMKEIAAATGAQKFISDAKVGSDAVISLVEQTKTFLGEEGDSLTDKGTVMGLYSGTKNINAAFNGED